MEKKIIEVPISFSFDWTYGVKISQLKKDIEELEKLGATDVNIEADDYSIFITAFSERIETDEEFDLRIERANKEKRILELEELQLLEKLKLKYESK